MENKKKVIAAMSGGVDSSVAAAILKNRGYDVVGIFMKFWKQPGIKDENKCCSAEAQMDVRRVAAEIGIPVYFLDVRKEFKKSVVDYFINEYKKGNTPNPCVECNKYIKFRFLVDTAIKLKADYVATGHYARIKKGKLLTAKDTKKDQTYFLWTLNKKQLDKILFPIGDYTKTEVRAMAKKFRLPVFDKKDSQEICFINTDIQDFLSRNIKAKSGDIITTEGEKRGRHKGLVFYTIGQRKGIKIGGIGPFYVVKKDFKDNALIVGQSDFNEALFKKEMVVKNVNWVSGKPYNGKCKVKIRSMAKVVPARIMNCESRIKNCVKVIFNENQRAITPGQSAVFYLKDEVLGGGVIM
jgi:tRNA-specific 2-thiouridylase